LGYGLFGDGEAAGARANPGTYDFDKAKAELQQYRNVRKYFLGDYYPPTESTVRSRLRMRDGLGLSRKIMYTYYVRTEIGGCKMKKDAPERLMSAEEKAAQLSRLIQEAVSKPGVKDVIRVYEAWRRFDQAVRPYQQATAVKRIVSASNASSPVPGHGF
jgi:hypothetical protein